MFGKVVAVGTGRARKPLITLVALGALVIAGLALAGSGGVYIPELGVTVPAEKVPGIRRALPGTKPESSQRAPVPPRVQPQPIAAGLLPRDTPVPISPGVLRVTNGWIVSDGVTQVAVYAGESGQDPTQGRVLIIRQDLRAKTGTQKIVDAGSTGALTIIQAPLGAAVETSAQQGLIVLRGAQGALRTLNLATDTFQDQ